ncbi:MAG: hypothetical protein OSA84_13265 [Akkermansiaceae bacterium]|nr:hypothetical protein [Akkermansiaceae bacterium]
MDFGSGFFVAEGVNGAATVIARQDGRYAFYRGETDLGQQATPNQQPTQQQQGGQLKQLQQGDYWNNLGDSNDMIQKGNMDGWNSLRRGKGGKGVEIHQAE